MEPATVVRVDLGAAVAEALRERILRGELAGGTRLVEAALAATFGTSRGPVRDAISRLEAAGLVTVNPRRGAYVTSFDARDIEEIYTLRIALETLAAATAAERGTADDWDEMQTALDELTEAVDRGDEDAAGAADMRFHRALVRASGHRRLARAWEAFADQTLLLLEALSHLGPEVHAVTGGHAEILDALRRADPELSAERLRAHLDAAQRVMLERFDTGSSACSPCRNLESDAPVGRGG